MLAEKFFLVLETLRSHASDDRPDIVTSSAPSPAVLQTATASQCKKQVPDDQE
jgi:hypothetical protein